MVGIRLDRRSVEQLRTFYDGFLLFRHEFRIELRRIVNLECCGDDLW